MSDGILAINPDNSKPDTSGIVIGNGKTSLPVTTASDQILGTNSIFGINESGSLIVEYENIEMRDTATADKKMRFYVFENGKCENAHALITDLVIATSPPQLNGTVGVR